MRFTDQDLEIDDEIDDLYRDEGAPVGISPPWTIHLLPGWVGVEFVRVSRIGNEMKDETYQWHGSPYQVASRIRIHAQPRNELALTQLDAKHLIRAIKERVKQ